MNKKRITGIIFFIVGAILVIYSVIAMGRIAQAKGEVSTFSNAFSGSRIGNAAGGELGRMASQYDTIVMVMLIGGIIITIIGVALVFFSRRRK